MTSLLQIYKYLLQYAPDSHKPTLCIAYAHSKYAKLENNLGASDAQWAGIRWESWKFVSTSMQSQVVVSLGKALITSMSSMCPIDV